MDRRDQVRIQELFTLGTKRKQDLVTSKRIAENPKKIQQTRRK